MKKLFGFKKVFLLILFFIIVIAVSLFVYSYNNHNFSKLYNKGIELLNGENFDEAISTFNSSLRYKPKQKELVESKVEFTKYLKDSKAVFDEGVELQNEKEYLEAIDTFKRIKDDDIKRYNIAKDKINECKDSYIKVNLDNAKNEASNKKYEEAISYLETILKFDEGNKDAQALKDEYNRLIQQVKEEEEKAKKAEEERIAAEKAKKAASNADVVKYNGNLIVRLNGGPDPILGRFMSLRTVNIDIQPFGIVFQVIQGGFDHELDYDITFYLVGKTLKYSGKTSGDFRELVNVSGNEVPKGESIKIVIDFKVNGKVYTTEGYRIINDRY